MSTTTTQTQNLTFTSRDWPTTWSTLKRKRLNNILSWEDLFPFFFWQIWITRNNNLFNNKKKIWSLLLYFWQRELSTSLSQQINHPQNKISPLSNKHPNQEAIRISTLMRLLLRILVREVWEEFSRTPAETRSWASWKACNTTQIHKLNSLLF